MPKNLKRSLKVYFFSKLKKPISPHLQIPPNPILSSTRWIFSGCNHPKTPSFTAERSQPKGQDDDAATLTDIDHFLHENFKSLYCNNCGEDKICDEDKNNQAENPSGFLLESPRLVDPPPSDLRASQRFFVSPATSNSLIEEARWSASTYDDIGSSSTTLNDSITVSTKQDTLKLPEESVAVLVYTRDPYEDFWRSMLEMIEARSHLHQTIDWDFMEELLFCYLKLNDKKSYKYILGAFVDLVVLLRKNSDKMPAKSRKIPVTGERRRKGDVT